MIKKWWFPLEWRVWQSDPALSQCSLAARGFWLEMLCAMNAQETFQITGTFEQVARLARCDSSEVAKYAMELKATMSADVTLGHGSVTLLSRRLKREITTKEKNRLRKRKERCHADVTLHNNNNNNSNENTDVFSSPPTPSEPFNENWSDPVDALIASFPEVMFTPATLGHVETEVKDTPVDREAWNSTLILYRRNFDPATKSYIPSKIGTVLDIFKQQKLKLERNGTNNKSYRQERSDEAKRSYDRESEIRKRIEQRDRELSRKTLFDSSRQLQIVESNPDGQRESIESGSVGEGVNGNDSRTGFTKSL